MSETQNTTVSAETASEAYNTLRISAIRPAFLQKLAQDYNIHPENETQILQLEAIADAAVQHQALQQKQASHGHPVLTNILGKLQASLQGQGVPVNPAQHEAMLNKAASSLIQNNVELEAAASAYAVYLMQAGS
jgi:hypothetical protein